MTEIPEHLLKRSQARRAAASGESADASKDSPSTPATTSASAPAPAAGGPVTRAAAAAPAPEPAPKPPSAVVQAYNSRRRIPPWAMLVLGFLPVMAFMYVQAVTEQVVEATGPIAVGEQTYGKCSSCHGADGGGVPGSGYQFSDGEIFKSFPHIEDQIRFVMYGTEAYNAAGVTVAGDPDREGGAHVVGERGLMPGWHEELSGEEILGVVCHERFDLGGMDPESEEHAAEYELWCSEESPVFAALEDESTTLENVSENVESETPIIPIGDAPVAGSAA